MQYTRVANVLMVDAGSTHRADLLAHLFDAWPAEGAVADVHLGDLTAYNAARAALIAQRDAIQEEINAVDTSTDPDARAKLDALIPKREDINRVLRATQRPE